LIATPRQRARSRPVDERGFTLIEVIVAGVLLLVILLPSALILSTSTKVLSINQTKVVAANLLNGVLEQDRSASDSAPWCAAPAAPACQGVTTPAAPTLTTLTAILVNGVNYTFQRSVGWCAPATLNGTTFWTTFPNPPTGTSSYPNEPPAYAEYVTVTWRSQSISSGQVFTTPAAVEGMSDNRPTSSTSCPL
jgi:type II secretory pathway pseudopilin PulG